MFVIMGGRLSSLIIASDSILSSFHTTSVVKKLEIPILSLLGAS